MPGRLGVSVDWCGWDGRLASLERTGPFGGVNFPESLSQSETLQINLINNNNLPALVDFRPSKPKEETEAAARVLPSGLPSGRT